MLQPTGGKLDAAFGRQPRQPINLAGRGAKVLRQRGTLGGEATEDKAVIGVDPRHPSESQIQLALAVPLEEREADQFAVVTVRPTVIGATKCRRVAPGVVAYLIAPMRAAVQQQVQLAVAVTGHDDVL